MPSQKLSFKEKIGYGFGDAGCNLIWKIIGLYLIFFYTDIFGIPTVVAGSLFFFTRLGDAIFDPLVGIIADRTETRWGKFRPYLFWMAVPLGIAAVLTFTTPSFDLHGRIIYAYVTFSLLMMVYSMINVPYASLLGVMTADGQERTTLATFRFVFAFGGSFLVLGIFQPLFDGIGTKTFNNFTNPKTIQVSDTSVADSSNKILANDNVFIFDGKFIPNQDIKHDSLLFITADLITQSKDAFKLGVMNLKTNETNWVTFKAGKDTLGLHRNGATSMIRMKMTSFVSNENMSELANLTFVYAAPANQEFRFNKVTIKQIDYQFGFQKAVMLIGLLAVGFFLITFFLTRERIKPIVQKTSLKDDLTDLVKNKPWFILLGATISMIFFNNIRDATAVFYFLYYFKGQSSVEITTTMVLAMSTVYLLLGQASNLIGVTLARPVSAKLGKKRTFLIAMFNASVLCVIFYWLDRTNLVSIFIFQFLIGLNAGIVFPLVWSMFGDTADYSEYKNGRRATGLVFSAATMSQKIGGSLGIAAVGWFLGYYGYVANVEQTAFAQHGIRMMLSIYPAIGALLAAIFMIIYPLKESLMEKIETELAQRRAAVK
jgi:GPH family glycoside/pentoside/hexuronide:cation symporter